VSRIRHGAPGVVCPAGSSPLVERRINDASPRAPQYIQIKSGRGTASLRIIDAHMISKRVDCHDQAV
jgi:hypothetical protein